MKDPVDIAQIRKMITALALEIPKSIHDVLAPKLNEALDELKQLRALIRRTESRAELITLLQNTELALRDTLGRTPTDLELADEMLLAAQDVANLKKGAVLDEIEDLRHKLLAERTLAEQIVKHEAALTAQAKETVHALGRVVGWYQWDHTRCSNIVAVYRQWRMGHLTDEQLLAAMHEEGNTRALSIRHICPNLTRDDVQAAIVEFIPDVD